MSTTSAPTASLDVLDQYLETLSQRSPDTRDAYKRALLRFFEWLGGQTPPDLSHLACETYLGRLRDLGRSASHRTVVKVAMSGYCEYLIDQGLLTRNPLRGISIQSDQQLAPRILSADQRYALRSLVERECGERDIRGQAIFALGYWAGCRVSDVSHLTLEHTHVGPKVGHIRVGYKGRKYREIDLMNEVRKPLYEYLWTERDGDENSWWKASSPYVFLSQRGPHLTEKGIHAWLHALKGKARPAEFALVGDVTFHDLRHDFAHRCRDAGWSLEEVAYYLGHMTTRGTPAIQTTVRYTQMSREQVKDKLKLLRG